MKNRGIPPYTALCNHHFRFYFSNPERIEFRNSVEEKQFQAAKKVISSLSQQKLLLLKEIIIPRGDGSIGIDNGYINVNVRDYCCITRETPSDVYKLLRFVTKQLALELGYVGEMGGWLV